MGEVRSFSSHKCLVNFFPPIRNFYNQIPFISLPNSRAHEYLVRTRELFRADLFVGRWKRRTSLPVARLSGLSWTKMLKCQVSALNIADARAFQKL